MQCLYLTLKLSFFFSVCVKMVFFWGKHNIFFFTSKMIPCRKWMHSCENEYTLHCLPCIKMSPLLTCIRISQLLLIIGGDKWTVCRGGKSKTFFSKSAQHQMRMKWYRNSPSLVLAEWSELEQQDLCHLRNGGCYDTVLHHLLEVPANVLLWLWVQFPGGLSHMYYPLCPWAGHYLSSPSGGIWLSVNGWTMCMES